MVPGTTETIYDRAATLVERNGMSVAADFGDVTAEYEAIRTSAAIVDLAWLGVLEFTGPDRVVFLHNMLSNEVRELGTNGGCRSAVLNVQGKLLGDLIVLGGEDRMTVLVDGGRTEAVAQHLDMYLIADDVEIVDRSSERGVIGLTGPNAAEILKACDLPVPVDMWEHAANGDVLVVRMKLTGEPTYGIIADRAALSDLWLAFVEAGAHPAGVSAVDAVRIESGLPVAGFEAVEERMPLEIGLDEAISTSKGCYLGQETVIRILHRGHVNRKLFGLKLATSEPLPVPAEVMGAEKAAGDMTSCVWSPALGTSVGLAVLHVKRAEPGAMLKVQTPDGSIDAEVVELPFPR